MAQYQFGSGYVFGVRTDIANPSPVALGVLQDVAVKISGDLKPLTGSGQFPVAFGRGKSKIEITAKFARMSGAAYNALYFGQTLSVGQIGSALYEPATVPASAPYVVAAMNSASFTADWGVSYANGLPLTRVASAPTVGQYTVSAGTYTFSTADASAKVVLSYTYAVTGSGSTIAIANPQMGMAPTLQLWLPNSYQGKTFTQIYNNCTSSSLDFSTKQDDWMIPSLTFMAAQDAFGNVGSLSYSE
jgi:hypothetical protein